MYAISATSVCSDILVLRVRWEVLDFHMYCTYVVLAAAPVSRLMKANPNKFI